MIRGLLKIIIIVSIILLLKEIIISYELYKNNKYEIIKYYNTNNKFNHTEQMVIEIPCINLKQIVNMANDNFSNLNESLVYYKNNDYRKKIIIFGHSGMGYGTYFNNLDKLNLNDIVYLDINNNKLTYYVSNIYMASKEDINILKEENKSILLLITCDKYDKNNRLVVKLLLKST